GGGEGHPLRAGANRVADAQRKGGLPGLERGLLSRMGRLGRRREEAGREGKLHAARNRIAGGRTSSGVCFSISELPGRRGLLGVGRDYFYCRGNHHKVTSPL